MQEQGEKRSFENGGQARNLKEEEERQEEKAREENVLRFLDSLDGYLTLIDSLSSSLRQGWLELAHARHSMGASRISSALLDLKVHSAATSVQVTQLDGESLSSPPEFSLCKWISYHEGQCCHGEAKSVEDKLQNKSSCQQLRNRNNFQISEEKTSSDGGTPHMVNDQIQKERLKSLAVFGALVSPKLRAAQLSFETALETLVEIANMRTTLLSSFDQVHKELEGNNLACGVEGGHG